MSLCDANGIAPDDAKMAQSCTATDDLGYSGTYLSGETAALTSEVAATSTALRYVWALT